MFAAMLSWFTSPEAIPNDARSFVWLLPLVAAIAVVWKALRLKEISAVNFTKEVIIVFATGVVFIILVAAGLYVTAWLITG